jgi:hypothetical protein
MRESNHSILAPVAEMPSTGRSLTRRHLFLKEVALAERGLAGRLQRLQSCRIRTALLPGGIFLKKMPPFSTLKRVHELWNRSKN